MAGRMMVKGTVFNTNNNATDLDGYAVPPIAENLGIGQIAVNTSETDPCVFFKTTSGKIVKIVSEEKLTQALTDILGNSASDLDTLRELIAQFEGSANDILPLLTDLKRRVEEAEAEIATKADSSALNAHISNQSNPHNVTKDQVGLGNVNNTSDANKPVSTAQASAIADAKKAGTDAQSNLTAHTSNTSNPHSVTKAQVGLDKVQNLSPSEMPISSATQGALDGKLGKGETAVNSNKLGNKGPKEFLKTESFTSAEFETLIPNSISEISSHETGFLDGDLSGLGVEGTLVNFSPRASSDSNTVSFQLVVPSNENKGLYYSSWYSGKDARRPFTKVWDTLNANRSDADWNARHLSLNGSLTRSGWLNNTQIIASLGSDDDKQIYLGNPTVNAIVLEAKDYNSAFVKDSGGKIWNAKNSNKDDVDWNAKTLFCGQGLDRGLRVGVRDDFFAISKIDTCTRFTHAENYKDAEIGHGSFDFFIDSVQSPDKPRFKIRDRQTEFVSILSNGNVGIGETLPTNKLTVLGDNDDGTPIAGVYNSSPYSVPTEKKIGAALALGKKDGTRFQPMASIYASPSSNSSSGEGYFAINVRKNNSLVERFRIDKDGNVGIGVTNPTEKLDVAGSIRANKNIYADCLISAGETDGAFFGSAQYGLGGGKKGALIYAYGANPITFAIDTGSRSVMDSSGRWGLGTENPTERLQVDGNILANKVKILSTVSEGCVQFGERADGTDLGVISGRNATNMANLAVLADLSDFGGSGSFKGNVTAKGDIVALKTEAMVFTASEYAAGATKLNDLIDIKLPENLSARMVLAYDPTQENVDGSRGGYTFMPSAGTGTGTVSATEISSLPEHNHDDIVYASDIRLKENILPLRNATIMLNNLRPKEYNWNEKGRMLGFRDPKAYGLIAQEVEGLREIIDLVKPLKGGESGYLGVDYVKLVPVLVAGFQEQCAEIIESKNLIKSVRLSANKAYSKEVENSRKIEHLENRIIELENLLSKNNGNYCSF